MTWEGRYSSVPLVFQLMQPFPPNLMLVAGDAIHNLRAALDHVIWEAAYRSGIPLDPPLLKKIKFPVRGSVRDFCDAIESLEYLSEMAKHHFKTVEVCRGGAGEPLYHLHKLDIIDKHSIIPVIEASIVVPSIELHHPYMDGRGPIRHVAQEARLSFSEDANFSAAYYKYYGIAHFGINISRSVEVKTPEGIQLKIVFGEHQPYPGLPIAETLLKLVEDVDQVIRDAFRAV